MKQQRVANHLANLLVEVKASQTPLVVVVDVGSVLLELPMFALQHEARDDLAKPVNMVHDVDDGMELWLRAACKTRSCFANVSKLSVQTGDIPKHASPRKICKTN